MPKIPDSAQMRFAADVLACGGSWQDVAHELVRSFGPTNLDAGERAVDLLKALVREGNADAHVEMLAVAQAERTRRPNSEDGWYAVGRSGTQGPYSSLRQAMIRNSSAW